MYVRKLWIMYKDRLIAATVLVFSFSYPQLGMADSTELKLYCSGKVSGDSEVQAMFKLDMHRFVVLIKPLDKEIWVYRGEVRSDSLLMIYQKAAIESVSFSGINLNSSFMIDRVTARFTYREQIMQLNRTILYEGNCDKNAPQKLL